MNQGKKVYGGLLCASKMRVPCLQVEKDRGPSSPGCGAGCPWRVFRDFFCEIWALFARKKFAKFEALLPRIGASEARHGTRGADNFGVKKKIA